MRNIVCRGVRGAITAETNTPGAILDATRELLSQIITANHINTDDIASIVFSTTTDLNAAYPAQAAREMGWLDIPLLCTHEMSVPGSLTHCIRVLIHWNTATPAPDIIHAYLGKAAALRPDKAKPLTQVGIIGMGNFGAFWADILKHDHAVTGTDSNPERCQSASIPTTRLEHLCDKAEVLFLCVPISAIEATIKRIAPLLRAGQTVFDVCSVKVAPARHMMQHLAPITGLNLIATHPLFGLQSAAKGLEDLRMVMHALRCEPDIYDKWQQYFAGLGLRVVEMSPDEHDRLAAYSQGVTHYIGRVLGEMELSRTPIDTRGFETLLDLVYHTCNDTWQLFQDLQSYNPYTLEMRQQLESALHSVHKRLAVEALPQESE